MTQTATIYALRDPRTNELRYIGKTVRSLGHRLRGHLSDPEDNYRTRWVKSLQDKPQIEALTVVDKSYAPLLEKYAIALYRSLGFNLVNLTNGGEGCEGRAMSPETRERLRRANTGKPSPMKGKRHSAEARANMSAAAKVKRPRPYTHSEQTRAAARERMSTPENRARVSARFKGKILSEEHREKLRAYKTCPEIREKIRKFMRSRTVTEETREKLRQSMTGMNLSSERIAKMRLDASCKNGHPRTAENTQILKTRRRCRVCKRASLARSRQCRKRTV